MPEFFVSPESQAAIQREISNRQRRFATARAQVTEAQGQRLRYISQQAPTASNQLKEAYASSNMDDTTFQELAAREARQQQPEQDSGGFLAGVGNVLNGVGMAAWNNVVKPGVRGAFTLWDGIQEEAILRPLTSVITAQDPDVSFGEAYRQYGDSALRNTVQGDLAETDEAGNPIEGGTLGHGLFPGGQAQARAEQERTLEIDGHRGDLGRAIAHGIWADEGGLFGEMYGPGDSAYDITAGVGGFLGEVVLDPVAWGTAGAGAAIKGAKGVTGGSRTLGSAIRSVSPKAANDAAQQVSELGLVASSRKNTVLLEQANRLFKNRKVLDEIAQADEYTIFRRMKMDRMGLGRGDDRMAELIARLGEANTPELVAKELIEAASRGHVRERGFYKGAGKFLPNPKERFRDLRLGGKGTAFGKAMANLPEFRFGGINPGRQVSVENKMEAARDIDGILRLGKVGEEDRARIVSRAFRAQGNDEMIGIVDDTVRAIGSKMGDLGVDPQDVEDLLSAHRKSINDQTGYMLDRVGQPNPPPWARQKTIEMPDGTVVDTATVKAGFIMNLNKKAVPLPDPTDIRRATAKYSATRAIYQSNGWEMTESVVRGANKYLFKFPTLFTRFAYPVRNNLENAGRIAGAGFASIFSNPRAFFSMGVLNRNKFRDLIMASDEALDVGRGFRSTGGRYGIVDEIIDGADGGPAKMRGRWQDTDETFEVDDLDAFRANEVTSVSKTQDDWALGTGALTQDASGMWANDGDKALGSFRTFRKGEQGDIRAWRSQIGRLANDPIAQRVADTSRYLDRDELLDDIIDSGLVDEVSKLGEDAQRFFKGDGTVPNREKVGEYVDWVGENIDILTGGDQNLRRTIATRNLNGVNVNDVSRNKRLDQILREQYYDRMPNEVMGDTFIEDGTRAKQLWKQTTDGIVDFMATRPENHFTRSPLLAQVFADDIARSMPTLADDELRRQMVKMAADAGFDDKLFPQIAQAAQKAAGQKGIADNLEDVIDAAKYHSTDKTLEIAFDATQRSSFQEAFDAMVPFWDAFAEIGQSWGRIMRDNPNVIGRGMQAFQGARGAGFIYTNEMGDEVFAMPGGGALANVLGLNGGKPLFEAPVEGLNLITQGFGPGVGPIVQWGVGAFMPDTPDLQWARDIMIPYGTSVSSPSDLGDIGGLIGDLRPAWMTKAFNAWSDGSIDPVAWNSAVGDALKVLSTSGEYDLTNRDPEIQKAEHARLQKDAEKAARWTTFLRSALQMGAPTGPGVTWEVETDPDGTTHRLGVMAQTYYEMLQESGDQTTATAAFIETYGVEPFWIAQGKTNELREGPRTREGFSWVQRHGDAAERHPDVVGYFVPAEDPTEPPDYGVFRQRMDSGEIESLTGGQQLALANKTKARAIYSVHKERVADLPYAQRVRLLSQSRDALSEMFPGWQTDVLGVSGKLDRDRKIGLLHQAVQDEALADSPVTEPLSVYLTKRQQAMDILAQRAEAGGAKTLGAEANADLRQWLYGIGQELNVRSEHFQGVWQNVLSSEVDE